MISVLNRLRPALGGRLKIAFIDTLDKRDLGIVICALSANGFRKLKIHTNESGFQDEDFSPLCLCLIDVGLDVNERVPLGCQRIGDYLTELSTKELLTEKVVVCNL